MIVDDSTDLSKLRTSDGRGYILRPADEPPQGFMAPFDVPLIPEAEWPDLIADMNRTKSSLLDLCDEAGVPPDHQGQTNFCAPYSVVDTVRILRVVQNQPVVKLSAASVAAPLNSYRNTGNWCSRSLAYLVQHGIDRLDHWPQNYYADGRYFRQDRVEIRQAYNVTEWYDGAKDKALAFRQMMTCLLRRIPCSSAHMWMSHAITPAKPLYDPKSRQFGFKARNSGYLRDRTGHTVIMGARAYPDEFVAPRVAVAS